MLRLLIDQDLDHVILRGLLLRVPNLDVITGIIIVSWQLPVSQVINDLEIIVSCSDMAEWENIVKHLPLCGCWSS